ncbi:RCC1 domain-containing protein [Pseudomonas alvandae]|uniref:RCC1 domain-containing protein n=1 Tax=Pseudomonas canavaninivorans TaxID=2842348 RepID=UPI002B1D74CB|nr:hypothetical protein [Pseudomonas canavaninivorans]
MQVSDPDNNPIVVVVDKDTLDKWDTGEEGLAVAFEVRDVVENRSEDWSAEARIVVDTGNSRLLAPLIDEAFNNVLDMDALADTDPVTAQVVVMGKDFAVGDQIEIRLRGTTDDSEVVDTTYPLVRIESLNKVIDIPLPSADVRPLVNTQAVFSYRLVKADGSGDLFSKGQFVSVIGEATQLAAPIALDAIAGTLDPALPRTQVQIPWDDSMTAGQAIKLQWFGTRPGSASVYLPDLGLHLITTGEEQAKAPIPIPVEGVHLRAIEGGTLDLYYLLLRDTDAREVVSRESLHAELLNIGEPRAELPKPDVEGEQDGVLDPEQVPAGTRLIVRRYAGQTSGDDVHYVWKGSSTGTHTDYVKLNAITYKYDVPFSIGFDLIKGNEGGTVQASYWVKRKADGHISPSEVLPMSIGAGMDLLVMGARATQTSSGSRYLSSLDKVTHAPLVARWQYEGDSGAPVEGATFRDSQPWRILRVSIMGDEVRINPANLFGSGLAWRGSTEVGAFVARRNRGDMVAWGAPNGGGSVPGPIAGLNDVVDVTGIDLAFAARRTGGQVVAWGDTDMGGSVPGPIAGLTDIVDVIGAGDAFAARRVGGQVVAWGVESFGGSVPGPIAGLTDIVQVTGNNLGFAARRVGGQVVAWGYGGSVPGPIAELTDIVDVIGAGGSFAARRVGGQVVAWGNTGGGGSVPGPIAGLTDIVQVTGNQSGFAARRVGGQVVAWGDTDMGGSVPGPIAGLNDIVDIIGTSVAFAARRVGGQVVAWGVENYGGSVPGPIAELSDIVNVTASIGAFAALRANGTVVAWGLPSYGGDISAIVAQLTDVRAIYSNFQAFAALTGDGRVVTWGAPDRGGDSSAVQDQLRGQISYEAAPTSSGAAQV